MKSRIVYDPRFNCCWIVERKKPGLFQSWEQVETYKDKNDALKMAGEVLKGGVVWHSDSSAGF